MLSKQNKTKRLLLQIALGVVIFVAISGIVLGLSIVFGLLKTPFTSETADSTGETNQTVDPSLFPYSTDSYRLEYSGGVIRVYMFPDLATPGTIDEKQAAIRAEVESWLSSSGIDPTAVAIEYRTK